MREIEHYEINISGPLGGEIFVDVFLTAEVYSIIYCKRSRLHASLLSYICWWSNDGEERIFEQVFTLTGLRLTKFKTQNSVPKLLIMLNVDSISFLHLPSGHILNHKVCTKIYLSISYPIKSIWTLTKTVDFIALWSG